MYLSAVLARKRNTDAEKVIEMLDEAIENHFTGIKGLPLGPLYYLNINPDFLIQVVHEYMQFAPQQVSRIGNKHFPHILRGSLGLKSTSVVS
jgi:tetratricopeptide repeat protein 21B